ncbi:radical SAM protein [Thermodesulfobacteriota bacterium]
MDQNTPFMLWADQRGQIFEHPYYRMAGFSGSSPRVLSEEDLIPMPELSKLFYLPDCPPIGLDPATGRFKKVPEIELDGRKIKCHAVAAFLEPGLVRSYLPAADYSNKRTILPTWAYTAVGFRDESYWVAGFRIEYNRRWDPREYDDRELVPAIEGYQKEQTDGPLLRHLVHCATHHHCFAAKNLFLKRWEAPLPVSQGCNAGCLGCLSIQPEQNCQVASHQRITFRPSREEIVSLAVGHLKGAEEAIVSFGQGCEGEPLTEYRLIAESIREMRARTGRGTINLNTNGSLPEGIRVLAESGLDSIRISMNSVRPDLYRAYYRPRGYNFHDVVASIALSKEMGLYTMLNYLVFPGITDQQEEMEALIPLIRDTGLNFIHFKNLNIDPQLYLKEMSDGDSAGIGMKRIAEILQEEFPGLQLGYFNQPVR